jgi:hypothetical protein
VARLLKEPKSLQQRELCGIFTRFPFHSIMETYAVAKVEILFNFDVVLSEKF